MVEAAFGVLGDLLAGVAQGSATTSLATSAATGRRVAHDVQLIGEAPEVVNRFRRWAKPTVGIAVSQCALTMTMARGAGRVAAMERRAAPAAPGRSVKVGAPWGTNREVGVGFIGRAPFDGRTLCFITIPK